MGHISHYYYHYLGARASATCAARDEAISSLFPLPAVLIVDLQSFSYRVLLVTRGACASSLQLGVSMKLMRATQIERVYIR